MVQSCSDVKSIYSKAEDGEYTITLADGNQSLIYCHDMSGTPTEYISLPAGPERNLATYYHTAYNVSHTLYNKVGFDLQVSAVIVQLNLIGQPPVLIRQPSVLCGQSQFPKPELQIVFHLN